VEGAPCCMLAASAPPPSSWYRRIEWAPGCTPAALPPLSLAWFEEVKTDVSCTPSRRCRHLGHCPARESRASRAARRQPPCGPRRRGRGSSVGMGLRTDNPKPPTPSSWAVGRRPSWESRVRQPPCGCHRHGRRGTVGTGLLDSSPESPTPPPWESIVRRAARQQYATVSPSRLE
jgi:hypothetical protein